MKPLLPLLPLVLSNRSQPWKAAEESEIENSDFRAVRGHVLERDGHTCRFCGFRDTGRYMQVHHIDEDHAHNDASNLVAACLHCHAVHHIGFWGGAGGGTIAWIPEFTQAEVSALSRAILVARHGLGFPVPGTDSLAVATRSCIEMEDAASMLEAGLGRRAEEARQRLGTFDAAYLGLALADMTDGQYADRARLLEGFRLVLPPRITWGWNKEDAAPELVAHWLRAGGAWEGMAPHAWPRLAA